VREEHVKIVVLCILASVLYGLCHDQVTVRVCPEYFTVAHPPLCTTGSATEVALCWGVAGTWSAGAAIGVLLARVAQPTVGRSVTARELVPQVGILLVAMASTAALMGAVGWWLGPLMKLPDALAASLPAPTHRPFFAAWFAHGGSYAAGLIASALIVRRTWLSTGNPRSLTILPREPLAWGRALLLLVALAFVGSRLLR
jgi:hypothetical protein